MYALPEDVKSFKNTFIPRFINRHFQLLCIFKKENEFIRGK